MRAVYEVSPGMQRKSSYVNRTILSADLVMTGKLGIIIARAEVTLYLEMDSLLLENRRRDVRELTVD